MGPTHTLVYQRVGVSRSVAIAQMRAAMEHQGWQVASENPGDWSTVIRWTKGPRSSLVEFADDSGSTQVWLRTMTPRSH